MLARCLHNLETTALDTFTADLLQWTGSLSDPMTRNGHGVGGRARAALPGGFEGFGRWCCRARQTMNFGSG